MKKKKLEAIPPILLRKPKRKQYMAVAETMEISGENHLIMDVYEKDGRSEKFIMRAAYTQHDWGLWDPRTEKWERKSIEDNYFRSAPRYDTCDMISGPGIPEKASWSNTAIDQQSIDIMRKFYLDMNPDHRAYITDKDWQRSLLSIESEIGTERFRKAMKNRRQRLEARCRDVPEIPKDFEEWADQEIFDNAEYVYYKRKGRFADCQCSKCGAQYRIITRRKEGIDGMLETVHDVPVHGESTRCLKCDTEGIYRARGRMHEIYCECNYAYIIQPYRGDKTIVRYFNVEKQWSLSDKSRIIPRECGRMYLDLFKNPKTDWYLHDCYNHTDEWCDHNVGGMGNVSMQKGAVYSGNSAEWTTRSMQYSGMKEYIDAKGCWIKPKDFLELGRSYPLEKFIKAGMVNVAERILRHEYSNFYPGRYRSLESTLQIRRCRLKMIAETDDMDLLKVLQLEKENTDDVLAGKARGKGEWTEEQIRKAYAIRLTKSFAPMLRYMSITQLLNRIEKYIQSPIIPGYDTLGQSEAEFYRDYINMRVQNGFDMQRDTSIYPKNLHKAHNDIVRMITERKDSERIAEYEEKYPEIRKKYRKLKAKYGYKADGLMIRPAKDAREIAVEGRSLHHCVGSSDTYYKRHSEGTSSILLLRHMTDPNTPYITIEMEGMNIRQWFGRNDTKPDREAIEAWLEGYKAHLEGKEKPQTAPMELQAAAG